ncbi:MAG: SseB family protein [Lachnospiraceae bacterium]|nr:SseB family protein [Lachnospiraceae bacterium]
MDNHVTREEKIERLRNLKKAYILYSIFTRIPFVECEEGSYYDQAYLFETREDAEEAAKRMVDNGDAVGITELKMVEMPPNPNGDDKVVPIRRFMRNQVREHLTKFPALGLNAVFFKPEGDRGESIPLDDILPDEVKDAVAREKSDLSGVQLTGIYFAQYVRRQQKDPAVARERYEEFYANLARAKLLLPVIPEQEHRDDASLNLSKCMLPIYTPHQDGVNAAAPGETPMAAIGLFTNMDEVAVHSRNHINEVRVVRVPLDDIRNFVPENVEYLVIDPLTMSITLKIDDVVKVLKELKEEQE